MVTKYVRLEYSKAKKKMGATTIKRGDSMKSIIEKWKELSSRKKSGGLDAKQFCGVIKLKEDAMKIQKQMRDEWR